MERITPTRRLLDHLIDGGIEKYAADRRNKGASWREVSLAIRDEYKLDVTHETLRGWFPNMPKSKAVA